MPDSAQYAFGPYALDPARRLLLCGGEPVPVTARAFDVLLALVERRDRTVEKDELLRLVWPDTIVEEANLSQQIFTIRKLLGHSEQQPYIATVPRRGYRFVAEVRAAEAQPAAAVQGAAGASEAAQPARAAVALARLAMPIDSRAPLALGANGAIAIAPDGSRVVYVGMADGTTRLFARALDRFEAAAIPGTEGASHPFFSPDGAWIGFQSGRRLQIVALAGGPPITLCDVTELRGATWSSAGEIIFAPGPTSGLWRVRASGGAAEPLTAVDFDAGERTHRWPHALAGGRGVIFTVGHAGAVSFDEASLAVADVETGAHRELLRHGTDGRAVGGDLMWARGGSLMAAPFDAAAGRIASGARHVQGGVAMGATGVAHFAVSGGGVLVHVPGQAQTLRRTLVTVDRAGDVVAAHAGGEALEEPRVEPGGRGVLVSLRGRRSDLWRCDCARGALERMTFDGENFAGIWGPDAGTITFSSSRDGGPSDIYAVRAGSADAPQLLIASEFDKAASSWSPDGSALLFTEYHPGTGADIWVLHRAAERAEPFVRTRFNEYSPVFSPDGRHVAYATDESGRPEVHVVSFPGAGAKCQLSTDGGSEPVWSRDGRELYYRSGDRLMRVDVSRGPGDAGVPTTMFEGKFVPGTVTLANYDVAADGVSFLMVQPEPTETPSMLLVTLDFRPSS
ncbi:MAG TPA: winged helix-turn-helix domain-containing protein [Vicinamibacterales bacterium]